MIRRIIFYLLSFLNRVINIIIMIVLFCILFISFYALYDYYKVYDNASIKNNMVDGEYKFDEFTSNVIGWINIYDTSINYPIVKGTNNKEYLSKDYNNEYSKAGSIFLDYRNNNILDNYSIIYGHNLSNGLMFSDIKKYKDTKFFNSHLNGIIYFENNTYDINIILMSEISAYDELYNLNNKFTNKYIIDKLKNNSINKIDILDNYNRIIMLSTCSDKTNNRLILLCYIK